MKIYRHLFTCLLLILINPHNQSIASDKNSIKTTKTDQSDDTQFQDITFRKSIKTVQFHKDSWPLSYPVMELGDQIHLILSFDDLAAEQKRYTYVLTHCNYLWEESRILRSDYIKGMEEEIIQDYEFSMNTHQDYVHYRLEIPNQDMEILIPGNYAITVYEDFDHDQPVLTRRFFVVEPKVSISGTATRSNNLENFYTHHEVDFKVMHPQLRLDDPDYNIKVVVMQNQDWSSAITDLKPTFTGAGELIYDYEEENQFQATSEFRHFETKNLQYITKGIAEIIFQRPLNHVYLEPDKPRSTGEYYFDQDINGKFVVTYHLDFDPATGADYTVVHFRMPFDAPITGGQVYVYGGLSGWGYTPEFEMAYNFETKQYELSTLLKQGYYDYQYRFMTDQGYCDPSFLEGSYYETENDYLIFVYYQDFSQRYQELIGFKELNNISEENR